MARGKKSSIELEPVVEQGGMVEEPTAEAVVEEAVKPAEEKTVNKAEARTETKKNRGVLICVM